MLTLENELEATLQCVYLKLCGSTFKWLRRFGLSVHVLLLCVDRISTGPCEWFWSHSEILSGFLTRSHTVVDVAAWSDLRLLHTTTPQWGVYQCLPRHVRRHGACEDNCLASVMVSQVGRCSHSVWHVVQTQRTFARVLHLRN